MSSQSLFQYYVVGGGWSMLLLVPCSLVLVYAMIRAVIELWGSGSGDDGTHDASGGAAGLDLCLVPLRMLAGLAPMVGVAGSATGLIAATGRAAAGEPEFYAAAAAQALVPLLWGAVISAVALVFITAGRLRIAAIEERHRDSRSRRPQVSAAADLKRHMDTPR